MSCCGNKSTNGPGYSSPRDAYLNGTKEKVLFTTCVRPKKNAPDYLAIVDVDPESSNYCQVVSRLTMPNIADELHHSGWNTCSSCFGDEKKTRNKLVLPCLNSDRIYVVRILHDGTSYDAQIDCVVEPEELHNLDVSAPHTTHCLPNGQLMISTLGDAQGAAKGALMAVEHTDNGYKVAKLWNQVNVKFSYDFWYQPKFNILVSTEWGEPNCFLTGFNPEHLSQYGSSMHFWNWTTGELIRSYDLAQIVPGTSMPLEVRFLHNPHEPVGYVGCALSGNIFRFSLVNSADNDWQFQEVGRIPSKKVSGWAMPELPALITDILISMDDRFLYVSCWGFGEVRQYQIQGETLKLTGVVRVGGIPAVHPGIEILEDPESDLEIEIVTEVQNRPILGGSQMLQLSLDGKRLYVTNSLHSAWDKQFYPKMWEQGSQMLQIDVDTENGGMKLNRKFVVDFTTEPDGPVLAHEMRYPGGDCTSDIFLAETDNS